MASFDVGRIECWRCVRFISILCFGAIVWFLPSMPRMVFPEEYRVREFSFISEIVIDDRSGRVIHRIKIQVLQQIVKSVIRLIRIGNRQNLEPTMLCIFLFIPEIITVNGMIVWIATHSLRIIQYLAASIATNITVTKPTTTMKELPDTPITALHVLPATLLETKNRHLTITQQTFL